MAEQIKVISQSSPGGRCTLYARYAVLLGERLGLSHCIVHSDRRDAHGDGYPSMALHGCVLKPADGIMLTPEDIHAALLEAGTDPGGVSDLLERLEAVYAVFLEELESGQPSWLA